MGAGLTAWAKAHERLCKLHSTAMRLCPPYKAQRSELSVGLCVADPHCDLKTPGVAIALDQMGAYGVRLQLHARLLATARLPALLTSWPVVKSRCSPVCPPNSA